MNNKLTADAAIFRPYNRSLDVVFFYHREYVHLPLTLYLLKPSISVAKPAVQVYGDRLQSHEHDMNRLKATPVLCLSRLKKKKNVALSFIIDTQNQMYFHLGLLPLYVQPPVYKENHSIWHNMQF